MTAVPTEVYAAFVAAGVPEETARKAVEAVAVQPGEVGALRGEIAGLRADVASVRSDVRLLHWQMGGLYAALLATALPTLWLAFRIASKVGALPG